MLNSPRFGFLLGGVVIAIFGLLMIVSLLLMGVYDSQRDQSNLGFLFFFSIVINLVVILKGWFRLLQWRIAKLPWNLYPQGDDEKNVVYGPLIAILDDRVMRFAQAALDEEEKKAAFDDHVNPKEPLKERLSPDAYRSVRNQKNLQLEDAIAEKNRRKRIMYRVLEALKREEIINKKFRFYNIDERIAAAKTSLKKK